MATPGPSTGSGTQKTTGSGTQKPTGSGTQKTTGSGTQKTTGSGTQKPDSWPLWEIFVRANRGLSHVHVGSLHAPDADMAIRNARDLYTRRGEGVSIWAARADAIATSDPDAKGAYFESPAGKNYRHAVYYTASEGVPHL